FFSSAMYGSPPNIPESAAHPPPAGFRKYLIDRSPQAGDGRRSQVIFIVFPRRSLPNKRPLWINRLTLRSRLLTRARGCVSSILSGDRSFLRLDTPEQVNWRA